MNTNVHRIEINDDSDGDDDGINDIQKIFSVIFCVLCARLGIVAP